MFLLVPYCIPNLFCIFASYMTEKRTFFQALKPGIPKRALLFLAGVVWTFAGGMLLWRGWKMLSGISENLLITLIFCGIAGGLFYYFIFDKISAKHTNRIKNLPHNRPCAFSFFNGRSYLMMALMITMGVTLRKTGLIPIECMAPFYIVMGTPLFISAIRFYKNGIFYPKTAN